MKFSRSFSETLAREDFPPEWRAAAIQYLHLKELIERVQRELLDLGLDADTLGALVPSSDEKDRKPVLTYVFDGTLQSFQPKLKLAAREVDESCFHLGLTEETKSFLVRLVKEWGTRKEAEKNGAVTPGSPGREPQSSASSVNNTPAELDQVQDGVVLVEIPLMAGVEFFHSLASELTSLGAVQAEAAGSIEGNIATLGAEITNVATPKLINPRTDLYSWRKIFRTYLDMGVFFANLKSGQRKERTIEDAQEWLEKFRQTTEAMGLPKRFKNRRSPQLFTEFLNMNRSVLKILHFRAINKVAVEKILKKFDKRTALSVGTAFRAFAASTPFLALDLAKTLCNTMQTHVLEVIPQLDDYLCPICQWIAVKPVRLECSHLFCIRCLVKLQREGRKLCPMCRRDVVLKADATNLDLTLMNFLRGYFPKETKEKQKENDREVVAERWRRAFRERFGEDTCTAM